MQYFGLSVDAIDACEGLHPVRVGHVDLPSLLHREPTLLRRALRMSERTPVCLFTTSFRTPDRATFDRIHQVISAVISLVFCAPLVVTIGTKFGNNREENVVFVVDLKFAQ